MLEAQKLTGVALVTGAASESAEAAAEESKRYATNAQYKATSIRVDVRNLEEVRKMVEHTVKEHGRIDYSVNSAGLGNTFPNKVADLGHKHFNRAIDTNFKGAVHCLSEVAKVMVKQEPLEYKPTDGSRTWQTQPTKLARGSIVNVVSAYAFFVMPGTLAYSSSKHGLIGVTKATAIDHARDGIRVNAVCPGGVETPMMDKAFARAPGFREKVEKGIPLHGRMAYPCEISSMILFLCSPAGNYVTGSSHLVDAGLAIAKM